MTHRRGLVQFIYLLAAILCVGGLVFGVNPNQAVARAASKAGWKHVSQRPFKEFEGYNLHGYTLMCYMPQVIHGEEVIGMLREMYVSEIAYPGLVFMKWVDWVVFEDGRFVSANEWNIVYEGHDRDPVHGFGIFKYSLYEYLKKKPDRRYSDRNIGRDIDTIEGPSEVADYGPRHKLLATGIFLMVQPQEDEAFEMGVLDFSMADIGSFMAFKSLDSDFVHLFFEPLKF